MEANTFYEQWNNTFRDVATTIDSNVMEKLDMFDDLDDLLDEDVNLLDNLDIKDENRVILEKEETSIITTSSEPIDKLAIQSLHKEVKVTNNTKLTNNKKLINSIKEFCYKYDFEVINDDFDKLVRTLDPNYSNHFICFFLELVYGVEIDCELTDVIQDLSFEDLDRLLPVYRNFKLSELLHVASFSTNEFIDYTIIKNFSLEPRDTGLLIQLMATNQFLTEEAVQYIDNADTFNAYLTLKLSGKYEPSSFNAANKTGNNVNRYTKVMLNDNPWAFLGGHQKFEEILTFVETNKTPIELAKQYSNNAYLLEILKAYAQNIYSDSFIRTYLTDDNEFAEQMASDYSAGLLDDETLERFQGNYYLSKYVKLCKSNPESAVFLEALNNYEIAKCLFEWFELITEAYYREELSINDYAALTNVMLFTGNYSLCKEYIEYGQGKAISFNKFAILKILRAFNIVSEVPDGIGSLIVHQDTCDLRYLNTQLVYFGFDDLITTINTKIISPSIKLLPENSGIIITNNDYNNFAQEKYKFSYMRCSVPSLLMCTNIGDTRSMRQNAYRMIELAQQKVANTVSGSFNQLFLAPIDKYLTFDVLLGCIVNKIPEFSGLCFNSEAIQLIRLLHKSFTEGENHIVRVDFLKMYTACKFSPRIAFERCPKNFIEANAVEITNSYNYSSVTYSYAISTLDTFVLELVKKNYIICRFNVDGKVVFSER